jgi:hypothetical protein
LPTVDQVIAACHNAANGDKFRQLFGGDISGYPSPSEADAALCGVIAFWSTGDSELIDKVFRQSKLYREKWDEARGDETYGQRTIRTVLETCTTFFAWGNALAVPVTIGCVTLVVTKVRQTAKLTLHIEIQKDGNPIDTIKMTDSPSSRKDAVRAIVAMIPDETDAKRRVNEALGQFLVDAARSSDGSEKDDGKEIHEILAEYVPGEIEFQYATDDGKALSRKLGRPFSRNQFIEWFTNETVFTMCCTATDAPRNDKEEVARRPLIGAIKRELEVLWGELFSRLSLAADTDLPEDSPAAVAFRQSVVTAWTKLVNMGIHKVVVKRSDKAENVPLMTKNSLASRVQRELAEGVKPIGRWAVVQSGFDAYFRVVPGSRADEFRVLLAMNFKLAVEVGASFPGAVDQKSLNRIGVKFGAFDANPIVPHRMTGGRTLSVLSEVLVDDILAVPIEDSEASPSEAGRDAREEAAASQQSESESNSEENSGQ